MPIGRSIIQRAGTQDYDKDTPAISARGPAGCFRTGVPLVEPVCPFATLVHRLLCQRRHGILPRRFPGAHG